MLLDATTKTIELTVNAAATTTESPVTVEYADLTTTTFSPASSDTVSNGTTVVTIVAAPAASTQRQVKEITIYNADTVNHTYTVKYNDNGTKRTVAVIPVSIGQTLAYRNDTGWTVFPVSAAGQLQGTATNDDAAAGNVGELISQAVASSTISLTNNALANATSIILTPGDWDVSGVGSFITATTTNVTQWLVSISSVSATLPATTSGGLIKNNMPAFVPGVGVEEVICVGPVRFSVSVNTTIYLVIRSDFTISTQTGGGVIRARRVR